MIIKRITIENFQSYYGEQTIEFSKGLNLIIGKGGKGKSKLFNAFYWVLFGKIYITDVGWCETDGLPQTSKGAMNRHEFINMKALCDAKEDDTIIAGVHLLLEDDWGLEYLIERTVSASRKNNGDWRNSSTWDVRPNTIKVSSESSTGNQVKYTYQAEAIISRLFPQEIRNYIWFQGESLESLIDFRKKETLEAAVQHISYYPYYQKLSEIITKSRAKIEKLEDKAIREANKNNKAAEDILNRRNRLSELIRTEEANLSKISGDIETVKQAIADEENKLKGLASYTGLVKKYCNCEEDIRKLTDIISEADKYQHTQLPSLWILNGIEPLLQKSKEIISSYTQEECTEPEKKYIDNPSRAKLEEIIQNHQCFVCGAKVEEGNDQYNWITRRMQEQDAFFREMEEYRNNREAITRFTLLVGRIQDYPDKIINAITMIKDQYLKSEEAIGENMEFRKGKLDEKRKYDEAIKEIKLRNGIDPVKQAGTAGIISSNINTSRTHLGELNRSWDRTNGVLTQYKNEYNELSKKAEEIDAGSQGKIRHEETEWKHITDFLEDICKKVQENARHELLLKIEKRANEFYSKFTEHDKGYKGTVKIDNDYNIEFDPGLNTSHEDRKKMSIINALLSLNQEAMEIYYPFISDAPTSNFDPETTHKYLLGIKDIFNQTIIMTKDVEIDGPAYKDLLEQHNVSRIYELQSKLYRDDLTDPELNEVSTIVDIKK